MRERKKKIHLAAYPLLSTSLILSLDNVLKRPKSKRSIYPPQSFFFLLRLSTRINLKCLVTREKMFINDSCSLSEAVIYNRGHALTSLFLPLSRTEWQMSCSYLMGENVSQTNDYQFKLKVGLDLVFLTTYKRSSDPWILTCSQELCFLTFIFA